LTCESLLFICIRTQRGWIT